MWSFEQIRQAGFTDTRLVLLPNASDAIHRKSLASWQEVIIA